MQKGILLHSDSFSFLGTVPVIGKMINFWVLLLSASGEGMFSNHRCPKEVEGLTIKASHT